MPDVPAPPRGTALLMRSEREMYDLILNTAREDGRIRAVILNGSRANPHAPRDIFQDYDIVYGVTEVAPFRHDPAWIDRFGERMILQLPDEMRTPPAGDDEPFCYLMQFTDGNRIDPTLCPRQSHAGAVRVQLGFDYPQGDDARVGAHLRHVRALPRDAQEIY